MCVSYVLYCSDNEKLLLQVIKKSKNNGIWVRELNKRTNYTLNVNRDRALKKLENLGLIKQFKQADQKSKKFYILAELSK